MFDWGLAVESFPILLEGARISVILTAGGVTIGVVIGLVIAMMRLSKEKFSRVIAGAYIDFFRGTPLLVQIFIMYFAIPPMLGFRTPEHWNYIAGILALGINSGAYVAEIFRAGIQSIDRGQTEAARSLGMTQRQAMRYVILPQAFKRVIPPLGNEFIALFKDSSLVSVIALEDLLYKGSIIVGRTMNSATIYFEVAFIYLIVTLTLSRLVNRMERRMAKSDYR